MGQAIRHGGCRRERADLRMAISGAGRWASVN